MGYIPCRLPRAAPQRDTVGPVGVRTADSSEREFFRSVLLVEGILADRAYAVQVCEGACTDAKRGLKMRNAARRGDFNCIIVHRVRASSSFVIR